MAGATSSIVWNEESSDVLKATITWLSDDASGAVTHTFDQVDKERVRGYYLFFMLTNPGATAPTDNYDITLLDDDSVDMAGGALADRDTSNSEAVLPLLSGGVAGDRIVNGGIAVTITSAGNAKVGVLKLWFRR